MSAKKAMRGRPKGSGIDDRQNLRQIAALLAADPDLKPTTAIKSLGFTDPSTIRRLRDKFNDTRHQLMTEFMNEVATGKSGTPAQRLEHITPAAKVLAVVNHAANEQPSIQRAMALAKPTHHKKTAKPKSAKRTRKSKKSTIANENCPPTTQPATLKATQQATPGSDPVTTITSWMTTWQNVGVTAVTTTLETQATMAQCALRTTPLLSTALKQQMALHALTLAVLTPYIKAS